MNPTSEQPFAGLRLHARTSDRRSRRRTIAWPLITLIIAVSIIAGSIAAKRTDPGLGVVAGLTVCAAGTVIWLICRLATGNWSRKRLAILDSRFGASGDAVFAIRSTASFDRFPPTESDLLHDHTHPWHSYLLAVLGDVGIELRQLPRKGQLVGARLRYSNIDVIADGTSTFSDFTERAILLRGRENGVLYELGIVPVQRESLLLAPVDEVEFRRIFSELVDRVAAIRALGVGG
jgi:hypothetical protein